MVFPDCKALIPPSWRRNLQELRTRVSIKHVHGAKRVSLAEDQAVVACLLKNGEFYLDQFVDHYFSLGFRHIVFLDNGSTDNTIERASKHPRVSVYSSELPVNGRQPLLKKLLIERAVSSGWCLDVDADEFFDYPLSDRIGLDRFIKYLNVNGYTAVLTQMLDMFSENPISQLGQKRQENLKSVYRFYDLSCVKKVSYWDDSLSRSHAFRNHLAHLGSALYWGGIRKALYDIDCLLSKHSFFRVGSGIDLFPHAHFVNGARLADVSAVLLHYKFASNAYEEASRDLAAFTVNSAIYKKIMDTIINRQDACIKSETSFELGDMDDLLDNEFLFASESYRAFAQSAFVSK